VVILPGFDLVNFPVDGPIHVPFDNIVLNQLVLKTVLRLCLFYRLIQHDLEVIHLWLVVIVLLLVGILVDHLVNEFNSVDGNGKEGSLVLLVGSDLVLEAVEHAVGQTHVPFHRPVRGKGHLVQSRLEDDLVELQLVLQ